MNEIDEVERITRLIKKTAKKQLMNMLKSKRDNPSFIDFELSVNKNINELGRVVLQELIPIFYGDGYNGSIVEIDRETTYACDARERKRELITSFGSIDLKRSVYVKLNANKTKSFFDEKLEIEGQRASPLVRYFSELLGVSVPFEEAASLLKKIRGINICRKSNQVWTESTGAKSVFEHSNRIKDIKLDDKRRISEAQVFVNLNANRTVYIETDGCHINTKKDWKECKTVMLFEVEKTSDDKHRLKNQQYYSTMKDCTEVKRQLKYMIEKYCGKDEVKIVAVCDGADWIWKMIEELFPKNQLQSGIIEILDWYHAKEKLVEIQKEVYGEKEEGKEFLETCETYLMKGNIETIMQLLVQLKNKQKSANKKEIIDKRLMYFIENKDMMRYEKYKEQGLCIGSGAIEGANKNVIQKRLKLSGMKWDPENADKMAHLRADYINGDFERHFNLTHNCLIEEAGT
jgi:hypothetical protein